jgi:hypothetical protein
VTAPTELLLRINNTDDTLRAHMTELGVTLLEQAGSTWTARPSLELASKDLKWPVDIPITPVSSGSAERKLLFVVDALAAGNVLAEARATAQFAINARRMIEMSLYICPGHDEQEGFLCSPAGCKGATCEICALDGTCVPTPEAILLEPLNLDGGANQARTQPADAGASGTGGSRAGAARADASNVGGVAARDGSQRGTDGGSPATGAGGAGGATGAMQVAAPSGTGGQGSADSGSEAGTSHDAGNTIDGIGAQGASCADEGTFACEGHDNVQPLVCVSGKWAANGACNGDTRCDTQSGSTQGTCQSIAAACVGKQPGDAVCVSTARKRCDADLLRVGSFDCPANAHCDASGGAVTCTCDSGYMDDGAGGCTSYCATMPCQNGGACTASASDWTCDCSVIDYSGAACEVKIDDCALTPCQNGGACTDGVRTRTCDCSGTGYTDSNCGADLDECNQTNVCTADYPCVNLTPFYTCRGLFPEWSNVNAVGPYSASGGVVTDAKTGLHWQQMLPATYSGCSGKSIVQGDNCTWAEAKTYCAGLSLSGGGWRLPTKSELESIVNYNTSNPAIDQSANAFPNTPADYFWTASLYVGSSGYAWNISFNEGYSYGSGRTSFTHWVRCVR